MKKGILSHYCCCGKTVYTRHTTFIDNNRLLAIAPFTAETANTIFCDGILVVVAPEFEKEAQPFLELLKTQCRENATASITDLIIENKIFQRHTATTGTPCAVYVVGNIGHSTLHPIDIENISVRKV